MSAVKQIKAVARDRVGKGAARAVRRNGQVPAVIYGGGQPATAIAVDYILAKKLIYAGHFLTTIFEIDIDGKVTRVIPRDYQLDVVKDLPVHIDFLRVAKGDTLTVDIPVHFTNQEASPGLKQGGTLNIVRHAVEMSVPADAIPDSIDVDLTGTNIGDSIHISSVKLPKGATPTIQDRDFTIATLVAPASLVSEEAAAEETAGTAEPKA